MDGPDLETFRDIYLYREMGQLLMDLDFDPLFQRWGEFHL